MSLRFRWAVLGLASLLGACGVQRSGIGAIDASRPDAARADAGVVCAEGTVDVNGDPEDGCECTVSAVPGERCNAVDDDCDGAIDEDVEGDPRLGGGCDGDDDDLCMDGVVQCVDGAPTCVDPQDPEHVEVCDDEALDEDCDGDRNEGCSCTPGSDPLRCGPATDDGICVFGTQTCVEGSWGPCEGAVLPQPETCDDRDEDCDGRVDDGVTRGCMNGCGTPGLQTCVAGTFGACDAPPEPAEVCNGADDDCDGMTDEDVAPRACANACGAPGMETCVGGRFQGCTAPPVPTETCNGDDDDCDGATDEGVMSVACTDTDCGRPGTRICLGASGYGVCEADDATAETCNDRDDDCDGMTDESLTRPCTNACGAMGTETCVGGVWQACTAAGGSSDAETCNAMDDDCDGAVDEGADCGPGCSVHADSSDPTHTYILCDGVLEWAAAGSYCAARGYHLADIETEAEHALVWGFALSVGTGRSWWIGLHHDDADGRWEWSDGTTAFPSDASGYDGWDDGWPGMVTSGRCARLDSDGNPPSSTLDQGGWRHQRCSVATNPFICEAGD